MPRRILSLLGLALRVASSPRLPPALYRTPPRQPENTQRAFGHRASRAIPYSTIFNYNPPFPLFPKAHHDRIPHTRPAPAQSAQHRCSARFKKHQQPHLAAGRLIRQRLRNPLAAQIRRHRPHAGSPCRIGHQAGNHRLGQPENPRQRRRVPRAPSRFVFGQRGHGVSPAYRRAGDFGRRISSARRAAHARTPHRRFGGRAALGGRAGGLSGQRRLPALAHRRIRG